MTTHAQRIGQRNDAVDAATRTHLPEIVQRYLRLALGGSAKPVQQACLIQHGRLRLSGRAARWFSFTAEQQFRPLDQSFFWQAHVRVAGPLGAHVTDSLVDGRGAGQVRLFSRIPVASSLPCLEMDSGALHRLLAESVWCPASLLPSTYLQWLPLGTHSALARLRSRRAEVELEFHFDDEAHVVRVYTPGRWGSFSKGFERRAWEGHFFTYAEFDGCVIPRYGDVGWYEGQDWQMVWEGEIVKATYSRTA